MYVDVAILTALPEEREAVVNAFSRQSIQGRNYHADHGREYVIFRLPYDVDGKSDSLTVALCTQTGAGPLAACAATSQMLDDLVPTVITLVGIAGCMRERDQCELGDVCIAKGVLDILTEKVQGVERIADWNEFKCSSKLLSKIEQVVKKVKVPDIALSLLDRKEVTATFADFFSGPYVLASDQQKETLLETVHRRKVYGIEMEAAGVNAALKQARHTDDLLMIKAYSDWAGSDKADENPDRKNWQEGASAVAAEYLVQLLALSGNLIKTMVIPPDPKVELRRRIGQAISCFADREETLPSFFSKMCQSVFDMAVEEASNLHDAMNGTSSFRQRIDRGHHFLERAKRVFGSANRIFAVSLDEVSDFWISPKTSDLALEFIASQKQSDSPAESVFRLFVFSTPEVAHQYAVRLDQHAQAFPHTYLCSKEHYERLLPSLLRKTSEVRTWLKRDYSVLTFGDSFEVFGELDNNELCLTKIGRSNSPFQMERVRQFETDCSVIRPGKTGEVSGIPIAHWDNGFAGNPDAWAKTLLELFPSGRADVFLMTGLLGKTLDQAVARKTLSDLRITLRNEHEIFSRYKIKTIRLTRCSAASFGRSAAGDDWPEYVIVIRFADSEHLQTFARSQEYLQSIRALLVEMSKSDDGLREKLDAAGLGNSDDDSVLEDIVGVHEFVWSRILTDDEMINELVLTQPQMYISEY